MKLQKKCTFIAACALLFIHTTQASLARSSSSRDLKAPGAQTPGGVLANITDFSNTYPPTISIAKNASIMRKMYNLTQYSSDAHNAQSKEAHTGYENIPDENIFLEDEIIENTGCIKLAIKARAREPINAKQQARLAYPFHAIKDLFKYQPNQKSDPQYVQNALIKSLRSLGKQKTEKLFAIQLKDCGNCPLKTLLSQPMWEDDPTKVTVSLDMKIVPGQGRIKLEDWRVLVMHYGEDLLPMLHPSNNTHDEAYACAAEILHDTINKKRDLKIGYSVSITEETSLGGITY